MKQDLRGIKYSVRELYSRVGICDLESANKEPYMFFGDC